MQMFRTIKCTKYEKCATVKKFHSIIFSSNNILFVFVVDN